MNVLVWLRRDLRVTDHPALVRAAALGRVLPLYIADPAEWGAPSASARQWEFVAETLAGLRADLADLGAPLVVRVGRAEEVIARLRKSYRIGRVLALHRPGCPAGPGVEEVAPGAPLPPPMLTPVPGVEPGLIPPARALGLAPDPCPHRQPGGRAAGLALADSFAAGRGADYADAMLSPIGGERAGSRLSPHLAHGVLSLDEVRARLPGRLPPRAARAFLDALREPGVRQRPDAGAVIGEEGGADALAALVGGNGWAGLAAADGAGAEDAARLAALARAGMAGTGGAAQLAALAAAGCAGQDGAAQLAALASAVIAGEDGAMSAASRAAARMAGAAPLAALVSAGIPGAGAAFAPAGRGEAAFLAAFPVPAVAEAGETAHLAAFAAAETGLPFLDACLRCFRATGWLNARGRGMLASAAVHLLGLPPRAAGEVLARLAADHDPARLWPHMAALVLPSARIASPVRLGQEHDPQGHFTRRWLPQLAGVPDAFLHAPWRWEGAGRLLGRRYPEPVIDPTRAARAARDRLGPARRAWAAPAAMQDLVLAEDVRPRPPRRPSAQLCLDL